MTARDRGPDRVGPPGRACWPCGGCRSAAADRALLRTFANHAALALERVQLREQALQLGAARRGRPPAARPARSGVARPADPARHHEGGLLDAAGPAHPALRRRHRRAPRPDRRADRPSDPPGHQPARHDPHRSRSARGPPAALPRSPIWCSDAVAALRSDARGPSGRRGRYPTVCPRSTSTTSSSARYSLTCLDNADRHAPPDERDHRGRRGSWRSDRPLGHRHRAGGATRRARGRLRPVRALRHRGPRRSRPHHRQDVRRGARRAHLGRGRAPAAVPASSSPCPSPRATGSMGDHGGQGPRRSTTTPRSCGPSGSGSRPVATTWSPRSTASRGSRRRR